MLVTPNRKPRTARSSFSIQCEFLGISHECHKADWKRYGKRAGPIRNAEMIKAGADLCVAFHRNLARRLGTKDCARQAFAAGIPTCFIEDKDGRPKRLRLGDRRLA